MNWSQFKDLVYHLCLTGTVVAFWSLTLETTVQPLLMTNIFATEFAEFIENIYLKTFRENSVDLVIPRIRPQ